MSNSVEEVESILRSGVGVAFPSASLSFGVGATSQTFSVGTATDETWFDIASVTKALATTILVMKLCDAGLLRLDEEVLPGVTLAHLLSHSSGFPACFPPLWAEQQGFLVSPSEGTRQAVQSAVLATPRESAGVRSVYSDLGFIILGRLVEERAQDRLDDLLARWLGPLDLALSFRPLDRHGLPEETRCAPTRRESGARELLHGVVHDDTARAMLGVAGHAGLFARSESVYRLARGLLDCYHDAPSAPARALGLRSTTVRRFFQSPGIAGLHGTWGLGFDHPDPLLPGGTFGSSAGSLWSRLGVGHLGFTGCSLWMDPHRGLIAVLLSNRVNVESTVAADSSKAALRALRPALHDAIMKSQFR